MKFVKTIDGDYINVQKIFRFHVSGAGTIYAIEPDGTSYVITDFPTGTEAQQWLDELIDELERDGD